MDTSAPADTDIDGQVARAQALADYAVRQAEIKAAQNTYRNCHATSPTSITRTRANTYTTESTRPGTSCCSDSASST